MRDLDDAAEIALEVDRYEAVKFLAVTLKAVQKQVEELDCVNNPNLEEVRRGLAMAWIGAARYAIELSSARCHENGFRARSLIVPMPLHA